MSWAKTMHAGHVVAYNVHRRRITRAIIQAACVQRLHGHVHAQARRKESIVEGFYSSIRCPSHGQPEGIVVIIL